MVTNNGKLKTEVEGVKVEEEVKTDSIKTLTNKLVEMTEKRDLLERFVIEGMKEGVDYAYFGGTNKPSLLKPGAEKLVELFNFSVKVVILNKNEDYENKNNTYTIKVMLLDKEDGTVEGEGIGCCSQSEERFRENNPNTILKIAKKRAFVDAVLTTTGTSKLFSQDLEDMQNKSPYNGNSSFEACDSSINDEKATKEQLNKIYQLAKEAKFSNKAAKKFMNANYGVKDSKQLTYKQAEDFIYKLQQLK